MKKHIKFLSIFAIVSILFSMLVFNASAASKATIAFSKSTVSVGDSVTVTVTVNPGKTFNAVQYVLAYDESVLKFKSTNSSSEGGSAGAIALAESFGDKTKVSYTFTFSATSPGTCTFKVTDCIYADANGETKFGNASANLTVKDKQLSSNNKLKSLNISGYKLSPAFSSSTTKYTVTVPYETTKVNVTAKTADSDAKVKSVSGNTNLKVGKNSVVVSVQAPNGTVKSYTITVTRLEKGVNSSENNTSSDTPTEENPLETQIAGSAYIIAEKIPESVKLFDGFTATTVQFNGKNIEVAADTNNNFNIYYLKAADSDEYLPYLYDSSLEEFERLKYYSINKNTYIFSQVPSDYSVPSNLYHSNINIGEFSVDCFSDTSSNMHDFYYVYCYYNGAYNLYRYDGVENTLQRAPDLELLNANSIANDEETSFFSRFGSLSANGKTIIICLFIAILGVVALIVLLLVYLFKKLNPRGNDIIFSSLGEDQFDEVNIEASDETQE